MQEARIWIDFNEMLEENLFLLSKTDYREDSVGNRIKLVEGMQVKIYDEDIDDNGNKDYLLAEGVVELNIYKEWSWASSVKWNIRINEKGIYHESD